MRKFFSIFIMVMALFSSVFAEDVVAQNGTKNEATQSENEKKVADAINAEDPAYEENQDTRYPSWTGWVFGASEFAIDMYSTNLGSSMATVTGSFGPRFNFNKMSASTITDAGFSIAGRLGLGVAGIDNFHTTGFAVPIELEATYTVSKFTTSIGLSFLLIPELENITDLYNAGIYLDLGYASAIGGLSFRVGYVFHSEGYINAYYGSNVQNSMSVNPLDGAFNFGFRWQL